MTADEFNLWIVDLGKKFPAVGSWIRNLPHAEDLLADWCDAMAECDLEDCLEVNRRFLTGDDDGPGKFPSDWETLPATIRRLASAARLRREVANRRHSHGEEMPNWSEPRYRCPDCRDSGRMLVASPAMISAWYAGRLESCHRKTAAVLCACPIAEPIRTLQKREPNARPIATYNSRLHYAIEWSEVHAWCLPLSPDTLAKFAAWCQERHDECMASKRYGEFDAFNRQPQGAF